MLLLHGITSKLLEDFIDLFVIFYVVNICLVDLILSHPVWEFTHLIHFSVKDFFNSLMDVHLERGRINFIDFNPNLSNFLPDL